MWDRVMLKTYAKEELKSYYWIAFAVCLVGGMIAGSLPGVFGQVYGYTLAGAAAFENYSLVVGGSLAFFLVIIAFAIFLSGPVLVGVTGFFIRAPHGDRKFANLFSVFQGGRYLPTVKTLFFRDLYVFLWSLLLVIPGIVKTYQYFFVNYLVAEFPYLTTRQALDLSREMTDGQKMNIFVLSLSFIGWYLLGALACGMGMIFVTPYVSATMAQLYFVQRQKVQIPPPPLADY